MASRRTHDVIGSVGEYTDREGQKKKRWVKVGSAFTDENGGISIKLDAIPVGPEWSGWLSLRVPQDAGGGGGGFGGQGSGGGFRPQSRPMPQRGPSLPEPGVGGPMSEDDIPF